MSVPYLSVSDFSTPRRNHHTHSYSLTPLTCSIDRGTQNPSKMRGWFDLFRENGGPTLYQASNRTPVAGDATTITLCIVFGTLYLAFFVIFPGVRKERFTTFLSVTLSLFVGMAILRE